MCTISNSAVGNVPIDAEDSKTKIRRLHLVKEKHNPLKRLLKGAARSEGAEERMMPRKRKPVMPVAHHKNPVVLVEGDKADRVRQDRQSVHPLARRAGMYGWQSCRKQKEVRMNHQYVRLDS